MAKFAIEVLSLSTTSEDSEAPAFEATGTIDGAEFAARTILWGPKGNKQPLFKVVEGEDVAQTLSSSSFTRGQRIAIARACKLVRLGKAEVVTPEPELSTLTLKQLRSLAKERGVSGTHRKGVTKVEVVELLAAA
jgi:hypothetical protein